MPIRPNRGFATFLSASVMCLSSALAQAQDDFPEHRMEATEPGCDFTGSWAVLKGAEDELRPIEESERPDVELLLVQSGDLVTGELGPWAVVTGEAVDCNLSGIIKGNNPMPTMFDIDKSGTLLQGWSSTSGPPERFVAEMKSSARPTLTRAEYPEGLPGSEDPGAAIGYGEESNEILQAETYDPGLVNMEALGAETPSQSDVDELEAVIRGFEHAKDVEFSEEGNLSDMQAFIRAMEGYSGPDLDDGEEPVEIFAPAEDDPNAQDWGRYEQEREQARKEREQRRKEKAVYTIEYGYHCVLEADDEIQDVGRDSLNIYGSARATLEIYDRKQNLTVKPMGTVYLWERARIMRANGVRFCYDNGKEPARSIVIDPIYYGYPDRKAMEADTRNRFVVTATVKDADQFSRDDDLGTKTTWFSLNESNFCGGCVSASDTQAMNPLERDEYRLITRKYGNGIMNGFANDGQSVRIYFNFSKKPQEG